MPQYVKLRAGPKEIKSLAMESIVQRALLIVCQIAMSLAVGQSIALGDESLRADLLASGPKSLHELQTEPREGRLRMTEDFVPAKGSPSVINKKRILTSFTVNGDWVVLESDVQSTQGETEKQTKSAGGVNSRYCFQLKKDNVNSEGYALVRMVESPSQSVLQKSFYTLPLIQGSSYISGTPLQDLLKDPLFILKDVRRQADTNFVRMEFAFKAREKLDEPPKDELPEIKDAFVVLDPQSKWCIRDYKLEFATCTMVGSCEYDNIEGRPSLRRLVITTEYDKNRGKTIKKCEFENVVFRAAPESEFKLTAFGLPEPPTVPQPQSGTSWYRWFAYGSLFCLLLALVFWRVASYFRSSVQRHR